MTTFEAGQAQAPQNPNFQPETPDKKGWTRGQKIIAGIAGTAVLGVGGIMFSAFKGAESGTQKAIENINGGNIGNSAPEVPGSVAESRTPSPEFIATQRAIDKALPYLQKGNDQNRADFVTDLDNVSALKGANYFNGRGENFVATANMTADEALAWNELQTYKADQAAARGDLVTADAIATATTEGYEHTKLTQAFKTEAPNVNVEFADTDAPIFEVNDSGSIHAKNDIYTIDQPGQKLYAFTALDPATGNLEQFVLRFTPGSKGEEGAWSNLATRDPGVITGADITQN